MANVELTGKLCKILATACIGKFKTQIRSIVTLFNGTTVDYNGGL